MSRQRNGRQETFGPLQDKTLESVLLTLFVQEFGYESKTVFAQAAIQRILETLEAFMQPRSVLKPGQLLWMAVANDGHKHAHQPLREIPQVPVVLDLVTQHDLQRLADGEKWTQVRRRRHARLLEQALEQGGVLAQGDLAAITLVSRGIIGTDIQQYQDAEHRILPYRGSVQDMGPTISHKVEIIRLFEQGYLEPDICEMISPPHSLAAVENYVQTYKNVLKLLRRGFALWEIASILSMSKKLVFAYTEIACEYHPDIVDQNPHLPLAAGGGS